MRVSHLGKICLATVIANTMITPAAAQQAKQSDEVVAQSANKQREINKQNPDLEEIIVRGQRLQGLRLVDLTDIRRKQANDLEDIFRDQPNVTVGGSFAIAQKIYVRGIEDTNLNVSIDGATQAGYLFHHQGRLSIEPELLKSAEVKAGAGTALDGPGALGGAIRFETKSAEDLLDAGDSFGALLKAGYYSNTEGYKLSASLFGRANENWSGLLVLGKNDTQEIEDGDGNTLANTSTEQDLGLVKIDGKLAPDHAISISHERRRDDGRRNLRPHFFDAPWNRATNQKSRRETTTANYFYTPDSDWINLHVTAYHTDNWMNQTDPKFDEGAGVESYGLNLRNTSTYGDQRFTYGVEYRDDRGYYINPNIDEDADVLGVYFQHEFAVNQALSLSYGLRFDRYTLDDVDKQSYSADGFSPNVNAIYAISDNVSVRFGYSSALRGPKVKEAYLIGYRKNAPTMKEETADNMEFGVDYSQGGFRASAEVYKSSIDDVVGTIKIGDTRFFGNAGDLETQGYNISLSQQWDRARLGMSYSHDDPELNGEPLDDVNLGIGTSFGDTLIVNASYYFPAQRLELGWNGRVVRDLKRVPDYFASGKKDGFNTHDLYVEWMPLQSDAVTVNLTVSNVFDEFFYDHGTFGVDSDDGVTIIGLPEPGRDVRLTLAWQL